MSSSETQNPSAQRATGGAQYAVPTLQAIVLDLDGTLYSQTPVRARMLIELAREFLRRPWPHYKVGRFLHAYRRAQEELRAQAGGAAGDQLALACDQTGADRTWARTVVDEWMERRPLRFLHDAVRPGLTAFLAAARRQGIRLGLCSDYPADLKLRALGIRDAFDVVVSAQDPAINRFKPHPAGLLSAIAALGASPQRSLYVGDRPEVDAETARRAGVRACILSATAPPSADGLYVKDFTELGIRVGVLAP